MTKKIPEPEFDQSREELAFIQRVISDSRRAVVLDATPFLWWGGLAVVGVALEYLIPALGLGWSPVWSWLALILGGWVYLLTVARRRRRRAGAHTLAERALGAVWVGCWTTMTLLGFVGHFSGLLASPGIVAALAIVMGAGYWATGFLVGYRGVQLLAVAWWLVGITLFWWRGPHSMLFFAAMILVLQIAPGVTLQRRWRMRIGAEARL